ncbi:hypothetical protein HY442_01320 [Candidatus Parcubacteria bacterium]|nr:hypothetical protein [Candidatus Parcubacteria bacterium]
MIDHSRTSTNSSLPHTPGTGPETRDIIPPLRPQKSTSAFRSFLNKWPTRQQWRHLPEILTGKEKIVFVALAALFAGAALFLGWRLYASKTKLIPAAGGSYTEGIAGRPRYLNPLYAPSSDADRDLTELIFSGLMRHSPAGEIEPDLAEKVDVAADGKTYTFTLRPDLVWHDGIKLTADDVIFTIEAIQNPDYDSPLRLNWQGVTAEKVDDRTVRFTLNNPYAPFLENTTVGIAPEHVWGGIDPSSVALAEGMLKPVGAGPYQFVRLTKAKDGRIQSYTLRSATRENRPKPYLNEITIKFFDSEPDAITAFNRRDVDGLGAISAQNV